MFKIHRYIIYVSIKYLPNVSDMGIVFVYNTLSLYSSDDILYPT